MNQALLMPFIETSLPAGKVDRWLKAPGESFGFGDRLCVIVMEEAVFLRKARSASRLTGTKPPRKWTRHRIETHSIGRIEVEVLAAEPGTMRDHIVHEGEDAEVGDILAVLQTSECDYVPPEPGTLSDLPAFRVTANHLEPGDD